MKGNYYHMTKEGNLVVETCPKCNGKWKYYNGCLGYESFKCEKCGFDINDIKVIKQG